MLTRLLLATFAALIVAGACGTAYYHRRSEQNAERAARLDAELSRAHSEATRERERADTLALKARELDTQLGQAKTRTTSTETKNSQLARDLDSVRSTLTERQQREIALLAELETLRLKLQAQPSIRPPSATLASLPAPASAVLAAPSAGPFPNQLPPSSAELIDSASIAAAPSEKLSIRNIAGAPTDSPRSQGNPAGNSEAKRYRDRIAALEAQLTELLTRALAAPPSTAASETPPATPMTFQVVRVGPGDAFVIIDYGIEHGASLGGELALCRGSSVIAHLQISAARPKFSVAQVLPSASKRQLQPGDFVLIAK